MPALRKGYQVAKSPVVCTANSCIQTTATHDRKGSRARWTQRIKTHCVSLGSETVNHSLTLKFPPPPGEPAQPWECHGATDPAAQQLHLASVLLPVDMAQGLSVRGPSPGP